MYEEMMLEEGWDSYDWFLKMEAVERYEFAINTLKMPNSLLKQSWCLQVPCGVELLLVHLFPHYLV